MSCCTALLDVPRAICGRFRQASEQRELWTHLDPPELAAGAAEAGLLAVELGRADDPVGGLVQRVHAEHRLAGESRRCVGVIDESSEVSGDGRRIEGGRWDGGCVAESVSEMSRVAATIRTEARCRSFLSTQFFKQPSLRTMNQRGHRHDPPLATRKDARNQGSTDWLRLARHDLARRLGDWSRTATASGGVARHRVMRLSTDRPPSQQHIHPYPCRYELSGVGPALQRHAMPPAVSPSV